MCTRIQCAAGLKPLSQRVFSWFRQKRLWVETRREHPTTHISSVSARHAWRNWRPLEVNLWPEREKARVVLSRVHTTSLHTVHQKCTYSTPCEHEDVFTQVSHTNTLWHKHIYTCTSTHESTTSRAKSPLQLAQTLPGAHGRFSGGCQHKVVVTPSGCGHPCAIELQISGTAPEQIYKGDHEMKAIQGFASVNRTNKPSL